MAELDVTTILTGAGVVALAATAAICLRRGDRKPQGELAGAVADIECGKMKEVKIGEKTILLSHTADGKILATGSKCTHYGAPLVKGVLNGDRIVCPWHGACFNACTGDIEDGPGFDAIPSFPVRVHAGKIYVTLPGEIPRGVEPSLAKASPSDDRHYVVIGAGPAGFAAVETLRHHGFTGRITVVAREAALPYDRTKLSKNMAVDAGELTLRQKPFFDKAGIEVRLGMVVTKVKPDTREVVLGGGETIRYDKLLCASGGPARSFRAPESFVVEGSDYEGIFPLRDTQHSAAIEATVKNLGPDIPIVIVGSSFIGMEAASYLAKTKKCTNITVIGMEAEPFERVLGRQLGAFMRNLHESNGVKFRLNAVVARFTGKGGRVTGVVLKSDEAELPASLVVIGAGIIPAVDYLRDSKGIVLVDKAPGGVRVDEYLRATDDVYVAGDIANFPYAQSVDPSSDFVRIEHWDVAIDQGRAAALNMLGKKKPFVSVPFFWTSQYGKSLRYAGYASRNDKIILHGSLVGADAAFTAYFVVNNQVAAIATLNRDPQAVAGMELLRRKQFPAPKMLEDADNFDLAEYLRQRCMQAAAKY